MAQRWLPRLCSACLGVVPAHVEVEVAVVVEKDGTADALARIELTRARGAVGVVLHVGASQVRTCGAEAPGRQRVCVVCLGAGERQPVLVWGRVGLGVSRLVRPEGGVVILRLHTRSGRDRIFEHLRRQLVLRGDLVADDLSELALDQVRLVLCLFENGSGGILQRSGGHTRIDVVPKPSAGEIAFLIDAHVARHRICTV